MAKMRDSHSESVAFIDRSLASQVDVSAENDRLNLTSSSATFDDVESFAKSNHLMHKIDAFHKAALLLQGEPVHSIPEITEHEIRAVQLETEKKWQQPKMLYFTVLVCSLGAVEQGWGQTGMNGATLYFPKDFGIGSDSARDNLIVGFINSGIYMSAGLLLASPVTASNKTDLLVVRGSPSPSTIGLDAVVQSLSAQSSAYWATSGLP